MDQKNHMTIFRTDNGRKMEDNTETLLWPIYYLEDYELLVFTCEDSH